MTHFVRIGFSTVGVLLWASAALAGKGDSEFTPDQGTTLLMGSGYQSVSGKELGRCVRPGAVDRLSGAQIPGGSVTLYAREVSTREEMRAKLSVAASASMGIGAASGSASAKFVAESVFDEKTYHFVIHVVVRNEAESLKDFILTEEAVKLAKRNPRRFYEVCGDQFISTRVTGGEFLAVVKMHTRTKSQKLELSAKFEAAYLNAKGSGEVSAEASQFFENYDGEISILRVGGIGALPALGDLNALKAYAVNFPAMVQGGGTDVHPALVRVVAKDYVTSILDYPGQAIPVDLGLEAIDSLLPKYNRLIDARHRIQDVFMSPENYLAGSIEHDPLKKADAEITLQLGRLTALAKNCIHTPEDSTKCRLAGADEFLVNVDLPQSVIEHPELCSAHCTRCIGGTKEGTCMSCKQTLLGAFGSGRTVPIGKPILELACSNLPAGKTVQVVASGMMTNPGYPDPYNGGEAWWGQLHLSMEGQGWSGGSGNYKNRHSGIGVVGGAVVPASRILSATVVPSMCQYRGTSQCDPTFSQDFSMEMNVQE